MNFNHLNLNSDCARPRALTTHRLLVIDFMHTYSSTTWHKISWSFFYRHRPELGFGNRSKNQNFGCELIQQLFQRFILSRWSRQTVDQSIQKHHLDFIQYLNFEFGFGIVRIGWSKNTTIVKCRLLLYVLNSNFKYSNDIFNADWHTWRKF